MSNQLTITPSNIHPIEFLIACTINLVEFIAWTINELAGHHVTPTQPTAPAFTVYTTTDHDVSMVSHPTINITDYTTYTVKQLRKLTGITNSRVNKAQLIEAALSY